MIKFHEIKVGDYMIADNDGDMKRGEVTNLNGDEKQVCVDTGQEFWYELNQLQPLPLNEDELMNYVHNLQNHFYDMTKVHLNDESFD